MSLRLPLGLIRASAQRNSKCFLMKNVVQPTKVSVRGSGGPRMMRFMNTSVHIKELKRLAKIYTLVGAIPSALMIFYSNVFVGDAVLYDYDPEVFQPEQYEFYKHPISRFIAKYIMEDPKLSYYKSIHLIETAQMEERQIRLCNQVDHLQKMESEGIIPFYRKPAVPRQMRDKLDDYLEKEGMETRPTEF